MSTATWRVLALETPRVLRHCPRCETDRPFRSSDKFRVNAQKRRLDVWLIYRCDACDFTWNRTVVERATPESIDPDLYGRYLANDAATAWDVAFDTAGQCVDPDIAYRVERLGGGDTVRLEVPRRIDLRLDRLLARELSGTRAGVAKWLESGQLGIVPPDRRALRRPIRDGQVIELRIFGRSLR